jgi:hypothetical protein
MQVTCGWIPCLDARAVVQVRKCVMARQGNAWAHLATPTTAFVSFLAAGTVAADAQSRPITRLRHCTEKRYALAQQERLLASDTRTQECTL